MFSVIEIVKYFQSSTKSGGYMEGIWRLYRDGGRLFKRLGYIWSMKVVCRIWRLSETRVCIELAGS